MSQKNVEVLRRCAELLNVGVWVPKTRSCGDLVLVDEPAEQVASLDHGSDPR
jgi:hypothetical protein